MLQMAIGLGSNLGDRAGHLNAALLALEEAFGPAVASPVYETAPMYVTNQPAFLNAATMVHSVHGPLRALQILKRIESEIGRLPRERNGPREIDLDLVAFGPLSYKFESHGKSLLQVPHPRIPERRFVLQPLFDIAPDLVLPGLGRVSELIAATSGQAEAVRRFDDAVLSISSARA